MVRSRLAAGLLTLAFVGAACASGGDSPAADTAPANTAANTAAQDTVAVETTSGGDPAQTDQTQTDPVQTDPVPEQEEPDQTNAPPARPAAVPAALQFSAPAVGGGEVDAAEFSGTPTLFWFWAPT